MSQSPKEIMQISEGELLAMTKDLDEVHHATLPAMHEAVAEWNELNQQMRRGFGKLGKTSATRRTFLLGGGVAAGGLALAACSKSSKSSSAADSGATPTSAAAGGSGAGGGLTGDLAVVGLSAALENSAVATYQAGLDAAKAGKLGAVPPAIATFATTAQMQHKDHAAAWNAVLKGAGKQEVTVGDKTVMDGVVTPAFAKVTDVVGLAKLALALENVAASTYLNAIQNVLSDPGGIKTAASIQPVEMQHSAILYFVLGMYPVPDTFAKTEGARGPDDKLG
ncbi:MAG: hypothetical protein NVS3B12_19220 [Acidimicrobiales bacterium]